MMARTPIITGNWKMNPGDMASAVQLAADVAAQTKGLEGVEVGIIPPYPFVPPVRDALKGSGITVGAQNAFVEDKGAFTGAVSTTMLLSVGCEYVLCGHSERRTIFKEDNALINSKVLKVLSKNMRPILCIGESKEEYESGLNKEVCAVQLGKNLAGVTAEQMKDVVIAYEPVWAIGTGLVATPEVAQSVHAYIRSWLAGKYGQAVADDVRIQYGGSVTPESVDDLMACPDIDGALVGGASLVADKFARICRFQAV
ncbi:Triosephosphate isomerase [Tribonema minus]|uniref:Triosephosphate isomerase n=1 Tax=Tribonema minus TaxID=303371 RepID=A0A835ZJI0_9STRA|nr:Triosephosphate isomerase [Tribonema minus]